MSVPEISVDDLEPRLAAGAVIVDVRQPEEYVSGHVPGAVLVPLAEVPDHLDRFVAPGSDPVYLVCRSGARSMNACMYLAERGLNVANVQGGTIAWVMSGRDVVQGSEPQ